MESAGHAHGRETKKGEGTHTGDKKKRGRGRLGPGTRRREERGVGRRGTEKPEGKEFEKKVEGAHRREAGRGRERRAQARGATLRQVAVFECRIRMYYTYDFFDS